MSTNHLTDQLIENPLRKKLVNHEFFRRVNIAPLGRSQVAVFIGQWWHPLHYFPAFLSRSISVLPAIESKCAIAKILSQETGQGDPKRAHEVVYVDTMERAGFTKEQATGAAPFPETAALVAGYERASLSQFTALGFVFATEVADLVMVSGIGNAVRRVSRVKDLEWVDIHVQQEPDHVEEAEHALLRGFDASDEAAVTRSAEEMWRLWIAFFDRLDREIFAHAAAVEDADHGVLMA
jgi:pyrroloquinoline quinone (PQQ) biosynthesis protein C